MGRLVSAILLLRSIIDRSIVCALSYLSNSVHIRIPISRIDTDSTDLHPVREAASRSLALVARGARGNNADG